MKSMFRPALRLLLLSAVLVAAAASRGEPVRREWKIDGVTREALLHVPADTPAGARPVVLAFHGHGGSMRQAARSFRFHELWPEAIVVYPQGLPTPGRLTDPQGRRSGWQAGPGEQGDRDLKFTDALLATLREEFGADPRRIYATGHSNGGSFTYLLWCERPDVFAAYGPSAAVAGRDYGRLTPAPVIHVAGENDELVKFSWQQHMISALRRTNRCAEGRPDGPGVTVYESALGATLVTFIHPGGHRYPAEAGRKIVAFFKDHTRPAKPRRPRGAALRPRPRSRCR